ncbi:hypothetical protein E306M_09310 [Moorella sp. E306M]|nr:hypothetical protein E306M_08620 [Moorella sp. E306M]GEA17797.1 hypothetical protein E306M_09310 [Moorella sp. E306M]
MYTFLLNMWIMRKITVDQVQNAVTKGFITQEQAEAILSTSQMAS